MIEIKCRINVSPLVLGALIPCPPTTGHRAGCSWRVEGASKTQGRGRSWGNLTDLVWGPGHPSHPQPPVSLAPHQGLRFEGRVPRFKKVREWHSPVGPCESGLWPEVPCSTCQSKQDCLWGEWSPGGPRVGCPPPVPTCCRRRSRVPCAGRVPALLKPTPVTRQLLVIGQGRDKLVGAGRTGTLSKVPGSLCTPTALRRDQGPGSLRWTPKLRAWAGAGAAACAQPLPRGLWLLSSPP